MKKLLRSAVVVIIIILSLSSYSIAQTKYKFSSSGTTRNADTDEEYVLFTGKSKQREITVKWHGDIWLSGTEFRVDSISTNGFLEINDTYEKNTHWLKMHPKGNTVSYSYSKNSTPEDINIERNQWYDAVMKEVIYPYLKATFHDRFFRNSEELITVRVGSKFPDFEKYDINNAKISNEDMEGKLTVINFWNIYCGPCIKEMPELHELTIKYNDPDKYNFIAFSSSSAKQIEKLFNRKKDLAFDFRQIPDSQDMEETLGFRFNPVHFVVDPDGIIIFMKVGYTAENIAMIEEVIQNHANSF